MHGEPETSETTYAATGVLDMLTFRLAENPHLVQRRGSKSGEYIGQTEWDSLTAVLRAGLQLNYRRMKVPAWTRANEAWEQKEFGDKTIFGPDLTVIAIEGVLMRTDLQPILWMEELDKFNPTVAR